jgi:hypothetical protein
MAGRPLGLQRVPYLAELAIITDGRDERASFEGDRSESSNSFESVCNLWHRYE